MKQMKFNTNEILLEIVQEADNFETSFDEFVKYMQTLNFDIEYKDENIVFVYQQENVKIIIKLDYEIRNFYGLCLIRDYAIYTKKDNVSLDDLTKRYIHTFIRRAKEELISYKEKLEKDRLAKKLLEKSMNDSMPHLDIA